MAAKKRRGLGNGRRLRSPEKVLLENAILNCAVASESGFAPRLGSLRWTFEIGGEGKSARQLKGLNHALVFRDGPLTAAPGDVPPYLFGFLR